MINLIKLGRGIETKQLNNSMKIIHRPPNPSRKGITLMQQPFTHKNIPNDINSGMRSARSSSRSRGISINRTEGIKMQNIYQSKHFPQKSDSKQEIRAQENGVKLANCKSLKLICSQQNANKDFGSKADTSNVDTIESGDVFELKINSRANENKERSHSPITKLNTLSHKQVDRKNKLLNF